jgi:hypothetical protein
MRAAIAPIATTFFRVREYFTWASPLRAIAIA